jgi:hypothetical protein
VIQPRPSLRRVAVPGEAPGPTFDAADSRSVFSCGAACRDNTGHTHTAARRKGKKKSR